MGLGTFRQNGIVTDEGNRMGIADVRGFITQAIGRAEFDDKTRSLADLAIQRQGALHDVDQLFDDDQPQASAAVTCGMTGLDLAIFLENADTGFFRNTGARITDTETDQAGVTDPDMNQDAALCSELDGIAGQIEQNLTQAALVGMDVVESRIE